MHSIFSSEQNGAWNDSMMPIAQYDKDAVPNHQNSVSEDSSRYDYEYYRPYDARHTVPLSGSSVMVPPVPQRSFFEAPKFYPNPLTSSESSSNTQGMQQNQRIIGYTPHNHDGTDEVADPAAVTQGFSGDYLFRKNEPAHETSSASDELPRRYLTFSPKTEKRSFETASCDVGTTSDLAYERSSDNHITGLQNGDSIRSSDRSADIRKHHSLQGTLEPGHVNRPSKLPKHDAVISRNWSMIPMHSVGIRSSYVDHNGESTTNYSMGMKSYGYVFEFLALYLNVSTCLNVHRINRIPGMGIPRYYRRSKATKMK
jgi:hypothetical protein